MFISTQIISVPAIFRQVSLGLIWGNYVPYVDMKQINKSMTNMDQWMVFNISVIIKESLDVWGETYRIFKNIFDIFIIIT